MDSPVRIQLKKNDYLRHKFFRTLNRRKKRLLLQLIETPEKELRRRLKLKRYEGGKSPMDYEYRGTVYDDELKNQGITHVAELPEVVVSGRDYTKPYESAFEYDPNFAKELPYFLPVVGDALDAVDVARDVYNGDYLSAGIGAGMLALPNFIEKPIRMAKGSLRKARKMYKRLNEGAGSGVLDFEEAYRHAMHNRAYKIADEQGRDLKFGTQEDKNAFRLMYSRYINNFSPAKEIESHDYSIYGYTKEDRDRIKALFRHNPEYYIHVIENNIKDPLSQEAVNDFINRQLTSIRGVTASNTEDAKRFLTETQKGRHLKGGDRLGTNGGLYVSNNPVIGDRFKNPVGNSTENGYVGILKEEDLIDRDQPIEELLRLLRSRSEVSGRLEPLEGTQFLENLDRSGVKFLEDVYVGRASRGTGGYERAYLPADKTGEVLYPVLILQLTEYPNMKDQQGRFMLGEDAESDPRLFIAKQLNAYDDYIKRARAVLKPYKVRNWNKYDTIYNDLYNPAALRISQRRDLVRKANDLTFAYDDLKDTIRGWAPLGLFFGIGTGILGTIAMKAKERNDKIDRYLENGMLRYGNEDEPNYVLTPKGMSTKDPDLLELVDDISEEHDNYKERYKKYSKGKDSGIHIKPENRGKFNALKKRTGKTTEELTHSKNPLTRKRAIFALNARKWNHKK